MKTNSSYPVDFKLTLVLEYLRGQSGPNRLSFADVSNKHNVHRSLLHRWVQAYQQHGVAGLESKRGKATGPNKGRPKKFSNPDEQRIHELEAEVAILKKLIELRGGR
ncbi:MAG: transposase [Bacillota bacterium]|jgi:transposase